MTRAECQLARVEEEERRAISVFGENRRHSDRAKGGPRLQGRLPDRAKGAGGGREGPSDRTKSPGRLQAQLTDGAKGLGSRRSMRRGTDQAPMTKRRDSVGRAAHLIDPAGSMHRVS